ncbi:uncharacterized protein METZ01_LOCUS489873, partial [marine metagenome]
LTIVPATDYFGNAEITVNVTDGEYTDSATFTLTVTPVNDAPVLSDLANDSVAEDSSFTLNLSASDIDGDNLTLSASTSSGSATVDGSALTVTPAQDFNGDVTVAVTASDGSLTDSGSFTLTVSPVNDAPVVDAVASQTIDEDSSLTLTLSASDVDGDDLTFSASNGNAEITVDGSTLTIVPATDYFGDAEITVNVTDDEYTDTTTFTLTVNPVNDAPVLGDLADSSVAEDSSLTLTLS